MKFIRGKLFKKLMPVVSNGIYLLLPGLINQLFAFFVIALSGSHLWGTIVQLQLYYYLVTAVVAWGNKEFLLVQFSKQPTAVTALWQHSLITRFLVLLLPLLALTFIIYPFNIAIHLCSWILLRHLSQSVESIAVYEKTYKAVLSSEIAAAFPLLLLPFASQPGLSHVLLSLTMVHVCRSGVLLGVYARLFKRLHRQTLHFAQFRLSLPFMLLSFCGFLQARSDLYCLSFLAGKTTIGSYQVLSSYVSLCLLIPGFLYTPYVKQFYTMNKTAVSRLQYKLNLAGIILALIGIAGIAAVMIFIYRLEFTFADYLLAAIYVIAPYFFMSRIYAMFRYNEQKWVTIISFSGIAVNTVFCLLLVPYLGITGALGANCISQLFLFMVYRRVKFDIK